MPPSRIHDLIDIGVPDGADQIVYDDASDLAGSAKRGTVANLATRIAALIGGGSGRTSADASPGAVAQDILASTFDVYNVDLSLVTADPPFTIGNWGSHDDVAVRLYLPAAATASKTVTLPAGLVVPVGADALAADYTIQPGGALELLLTKHPDDAETDVLVQVTELFAGTVASLSARGGDATHDTNGLATVNTPGGIQTGDRIIIGAVIEGTSVTASPTWTAPTNGNPVNEVGTITIGDFEPQIRIWETTYDGSTTAFTAGSAETPPGSAFLVAADGAGTAVRMSAGNEGLDPDSVASVAAGSLIVAVCAMHNDTIEVTGVPAGYTSQANNTNLTEFRTVAAATATQAATGAADPGVFTSTGSAQETTFTIVIDA